ncbi:MULTISPECIES: cupin domain-containing protein [Desulfococcus]|jgi:transcriptional regulator with XRE-family HTH domain|uniref:Cupin 2 conserved barrel domain protein n=1 Tax=Desulfococcus multivorans DSM 2059 TaxID=1121405 RepID=S7V9D0_DESML|nr:cupin domain-containing protein [Desulfococcus multivorans]AOY58498.1 transcriptional regulator, XRE family [Desulfococcus multivorans]AQV00812.1 DNA-binding protein [Desulfococcus multivorans]EPR43284.1 Cupin 2 conserved barrel domain protein [Desulfococcus multivorans DSM 2059]MDX9817331.1 cupin domain-containing protein [Desulfococcus multivorans]SJZ42041.1 transcriptional regulator, XRE family with cupin sensor [Desulfococcus multivorans DSM 2059]
MNLEKVGARITKIMAQKGISLEVLAERTGLESGFLKRLQEEDIYPSLGPLLKIARSLGVRLGTFLDDQISEDPLIIRKSDRKGELSMLRAKDRPVASRFYSLGRGKTDRHMEPFFIELLPESGKEIKLSSHEGEEFIVVIDGEVEVVYGKKTHRLLAGDSIYYNSVVPHHVGSFGDSAASIYAVLYFPE